MSPCRVITTPGVIPHVQSETNVRIPDLAVTCTSYETEEIALTDPVLVIGDPVPDQSSRNLGQCLDLRHDPQRSGEILVLKTVSIGAELLRRDENGGFWPSQPVAIEAGGRAEAREHRLQLPLAAAYRTTSGWRRRGNFASTNSDN